MCDLIRLRGSQRELRVALVFDEKAGHRPSNDRRTRMETSHIAALQAKHEGLERRLKEELSRPAPDMSMIQKLKKQKLRLKDEIAFQ